MLRFSVYIGFIFFGLISYGCEYHIKYLPKLVPSESQGWMMTSDKSFRYDCQYFELEAKPFTWKHSSVTGCCCFPIPFPSGYKEETFNIRLNIFSKGMIQEKCGWSSSSQKIGSSTYDVTLRCGAARVPLTFIDSFCSIQTDSNSEMIPSIDSGFKEHGYWGNQKPSEIVCKFRYSDFPAYFGKMILHFPGFSDTCSVPPLEWEKESDFDFEPPHCIDIPIP